MKGSIPKLSFDPGSSATAKILVLLVLVCFLMFYGLVYADGNFDPNDPTGEHPWDELQSEDNSDQPPKLPPEKVDIIIVPGGNLGGWIIINLSQGKEGNIQRDRVQIQTSDKNRGRFFIFF